MINMFETKDFWDIIEICGGVSILPETDSDSTKNGSYLPMDLYGNKKILNKYVLTFVSGCSVLSTIDEHRKSNSNPL
jgi:hypothetical protein